MSKLDKSNSDELQEVCDRINELANIVYETIDDAEMEVQALKDDCELECENMMFFTVKKIRAAAEELEQLCGSYDDRWDDLPSIECDIDASLDIWERAKESVGL